MVEPAITDCTAEAFGHPGACTEPAPGSVVDTRDNSITVTSGGTSKQLACIADNDINFPSHGHGTSEGSCTNFQSHDIDPDVGEPSITINGSPIYRVEDAVTSDPITGGDVNLLANPFTTSIDLI